MNYSKIGERLKLIRERKGLSYEQIFEITKIQPSILKGIEEGKSLVSPVFLKGFIKTYASSLGLDPDVLFQISEVKQGKKEEMKPKELPQTEKKTKKKYFLYLLPLLALLVTLPWIWFQNTAQDLSEEDKEQEYPINEESETQEELLTQGPMPPAENLDQKNQDLEKAEDETLSASNQSLFQEIKDSVFTKEILIQSSQEMDIYFKLDKKSTITKRLSPFEWFYIKAQESIYLRFDKIRGDIQIFYNGKKVELESQESFFERKFL